MCCYLEGTSTPDTCTPDGLCLPFDNIHLWRDTCTDPTWQDPACLNICTRGQSKQLPTDTPLVDVTPLQFVLFADITVLLFIDALGGDLADISMPLTACADGSYCCGFNDALTEACCRVHGGVFVENGKVVSSSASSFPTSPSTARSSQTSSPSSTPVTLPEPTAPTPNPPSSNTGPIVGGVVGGIAGVTVLALAFWYFILRRKSAPLQDRPSPQEHHEELQRERQDVWQEPKEVTADDIRGELDARHRVELDGRQDVYV
ncbi:MAG: hypothetical protein LQ337_006308 [Flavoplaca oasis]|nr:MAG: hypothetical protein LQ337_006308 [Flavoplaca oasis]